MTNEEKILELLEKQGELLEKQGKLLEEVDQRSERTAVLLETEYRDKLQLLFDGHKFLNDKLDKLAPKTQVEALEDEVSFLRATVISLDKRLDALEKAQ